MNGETLPAAAATSGGEDERLLRQAQVSSQASPFDYIIVGSGAGGGPLAARLALAGKRVLLIDAGRDPAHERSRTYPDAGEGEVHDCPCYHAAATEDRAMSWQFSVRHYADTERQKKDEKYNRIDPPDPRFLDPAAGGGKHKDHKGGIFYPRSAAIGGCTAHHAMILAIPNDRDWNYIADLTGDASWRASEMQGYFARLERCLYLDAYQGWIRNLLGPIYTLWQKLVLLFDPRSALDEGGHGREGWQPTSFIEPTLIEGISREDRGFTGVLIGSALAVLHSDNRLIGMLKRSLVWLRVVQHVDPNDQNTRRTSPEGAFLIPTGVEGGDAVDHEGKVMLGRRAGVRELVLGTQAKHPDRLVIKMGTHVRRVLFEHPPDGVPRAVGIEATVGDDLYEASPLRASAPSSTVRYYASGEVILCGGAFNTPQLLMLSGIGDKEHLAKHGIQCLADLPGVGRNLQDRYEVSVISELDDDFVTLEGVTFKPGDREDPARQQWLRDGGGLYRTNGGTLAVLRRSIVLAPDEPEPDVFTFGAPAAFRGYYWGWSRELLRRTLGATEDQRNLWSWIILKAYTRNDAGTVRLRSPSPFDQPEICFDSFNEKAELEAVEIARLSKPWIDAGKPLPPDLARRAEVNRAILADSERDLAAVADSVRFMREINARNSGRFVREIQPGTERPDGSEALKEWIRSQAWGHHASCTCRMGSDAWQKKPADLRDRGAVLDSRLRVHGVRGLRIVDASVFPKIPGYFIVTPIMMISEKAADMLLADSVYPRELQVAEADAIRERRAKAHRVTHEADPEAASAGAAGPPSTDESKLPADTVGVALSGGGIRSSTFALGVLQGLAERNRLRDVDILSTVSGGGFIGSFLGRIFTRALVKESADPVGRVQETLKDSRSAPLWWLRTQANYIFASGSSDVRINLAVFWRNILSVHLVIGALLFAVFGLLAWLPGRLSMPPAPEPLGIPLSPWWWLPVVALGVGVIPATLGYWLAPKTGSYRPYAFFSLLAWLVLLAGALLALQIPHGLLFAGGGLVLLLLSWVWQEAARWGTEPGRELKAAWRRWKMVKRRGSATEAERDALLRKMAAARQQVGTVVRNRLSRSLGELLVIFGVLLGWVALDTLARLFAWRTPAAALAALMVALAPALPLLRWIAMQALRQISAGEEKRLSAIGMAKLLGIPLAIFLLAVVDLLAHRLFLYLPETGIWIVVLAALFSAALGRAFDFLNLSSLRATYAARLSRTFQGASNAERVFSSTDSLSRDVQLAHPGDDVPHDQYHPERSGGPLHLINVCINETVDVASEREVRERKGLPMCVTPHGVSVGRRYFAQWTPPDDLPRWQKRRRWRDGLDAEDALPLEERRRTALEALPVAADPMAFHVLKTKKSRSAEVEPLTLGTWTAISGAAFSTGIGRGTTLPLSLFMGLANVRLGYWWDSGILPRERPGRYPLSLWRRIKRFPSQLFCMQSMLLAEWRARFRGPSQWFWYLSDGGHFEVTGVYELLRRRVPLILLSDAGEDGKYQFEDVAQLARQARQDFGAQIEWLDAPTAGNLPPLVTEWINTDALGRIADIRRSGSHHAALARVTYDHRSEVSWILLLKPSLGLGAPQDVVNHAAQHASFPQDPTVDQVFDDNQWESYRALGQHIALQVLKPPRP